MCAHLCALRRVKVELCIAFERVGHVADGVYEAAANINGKPADERGRTDDGEHNGKDDHIVRLADEYVLVGDGVDRPAARLRKPLELDRAEHIDGLLARRGGFAHVGMRTVGVDARPLLLCGAHEVERVLHDEVFADAVTDDIALMIDDEVEILRLADGGEIVLELRHVKVEGQRSDEPSVLHDRHAERDHKHLLARNFFVVRRRDGRLARLTRL